MFTLVQALDNQQVKEFMLFLKARSDKAVDKIVKTEKAGRVLDPYVEENLTQALVVAGNIRLQLHAHLSKLAIEDKAQRNAVSTAKALKAFTSRESRKVHPRFNREVAK